METTKKAAADLLAAAVARVESASIRAWVMTEHNAPIWLQIAEASVKKGRSANVEDDVLRLTIDITCTAIGA